MKENLPKRIQDYLNRKRPQPKVTQNVKDEAEPVDEKAELELAYEEWKDTFKIPILIFKCVLGFVFVVCFIWALAVVNIQTNCYLDKDCREWIKR